MNEPDKTPGAEQRRARYRQEDASSKPESGAALDLLSGILKLGGDVGAVKVPEGRTQFFDRTYNFAAAISYLPILNVLAPLLWLTTESRDNKYLRFHSIQGLSLFGVLIAIRVAAGTLAGILFFIPGLKIVISIFSSIVIFLWTVVCLKQTLRVYRRQKARLPLLSDFADRFV